MPIRDPLDNNNNNNNTGDNMHNTPVPAICPDCGGHYVMAPNAWTYRCDSGCGELATTDVYLEHDETIEDVTIDGRRVLAIVTLDTTDEDED